MERGGIFIDHSKISRLREGVSERLLAVFPDAAYCPRVTEKGLYWDWNVEEGEDRFEPLTVHEWKIGAREAKERLDALGIREDDIRDAIEDSGHSKAQRLRELADDPNLREAFPANVLLLDALDELTLESWSDVARLAHKRSGFLTMRDAAELGTLGELITLPWYWPEELLLRLYCYAFPDSVVTLDLTEMVEDGLIDVGPHELCSAALQNMQHDAKSNSTTIVLVEGKSDAQALNLILRTLAEHLTDLVRVMDFDQRPEGGAGQLVKTVRAFAAAGVQNKTLAIFDNDTAARDAMRKLEQAVLPAGVHVRRLPDIELLQQYPTLGPIPGSDGEPAVYHTDVNGLAASIELYFGRDVLRRSDDSLMPVQWTSYNTAMRRYQGEVLDKERLQVKFRAKCEAALSGSGDDGAVDWSGARAILDLIKDVLAQ